METLFQLKSLRESNLHLVPADLKEYLKMLLSLTPDLRPDAKQFSKIGFFDDIGVKTLNNLVGIDCRMKFPYLKSKE